MLIAVKKLRLRRDVESRVEVQLTPSRRFFCMRSVWGLKDLPGGTCKSG